MKLNKKMVAINVLATLLISESAMARIQGVRTPATSGGNSSAEPSSRGKPSTTKISTAVKEESQKVVAVNEASCSGDMEAAKYFPQELFSNITRDGSNLQIEVRQNNKVVVKIPPILNVCGNFIPELRQNTETKNVAVLMKLIGTRKEKVMVDGVEQVKETKDVELTYKEFEDCLEEQNLMVDGKINHDAIPGKKYSENIYSMDFDFDKKADVKKTATVSFAYPKEYKDPNNGYNALYGFDDKVNVAGESCMLAEKIADEPVYINKGKDVLIQEINDICKSGDAQKIAEARKSIGNADALKDIADKIRAEMDAGYLIAVKADVARISADMTKIEDKLNKNKDTMDESQAKKEIGKYAELAKELDTKFLNPAIFRLDTLMQKRAAIEDEDSPEIKELDAEIKKINEDVGQFSKRNPTSFASVYSVMEKYAINDAAKTVEDIRLKSYLYAKVYAGRQDDKRGKPLSFESANQQQYQKLQKFDKTLNDWTDQYLVSKGNMLPIQRTEKERTAAIEKMNSRYAAFEKKELSDYNSYCAVGMLGSVKNPVKCQEFVNGREKRMSAELKRREKDLMYIKGRNEKLSKMGTNYNEYQRTLASREEAEEDYEPYGSSYTSYEDNFSDRFPGYYGPTTSTAYNAANYNMGGTSAAMGMGQQSAQMGQQMQYGQQQGYQYQMQNTNQMGAWPSVSGF